MSFLDVATGFVERSVVKKFLSEPLHYLIYAEGTAPKLPGVYGIYKVPCLSVPHPETVLYIGKVASKDGLSRRLQEHFDRIKHLDDCLVYRALVLENEWLSSAAEATLIAKYRPLLNGSGFGTRTRRSVDGPSNWEQLLK